MIFWYFLSSTFSYFWWVHEGNWFFKTCPFGSGARMVIPNTYPSLSNIVHTDFELGRVIQTVVAADPGITVVIVTLSEFSKMSCTTKPQRKSDISQLRAKQISNSHILHRRLRGSETSAWKAKSTKTTRFLGGRTKPNSTIIAWH